MGNINWIGRPALGVLTLCFLGSTALAQANGPAMEPVLTGARAENSRHNRAQDSIFGDGQPRRNARSGVLDWGTGGVALRAERLRWGSKAADTLRLGSRWQRTYAADVSFRESATADIAIEAGARLERTSRGLPRGALLTNSTNTVTQIAYVGAQLSGSASIRLIGFDRGGWSDGATGQLVSRIANGEPAARKGAAIEIWRFASRPGDAREEPQFTLRVERGRIAARPEISANLSWKDRF